MKKIVKFEIEDIGIDHAQYFKGRSTTYTEWYDVFIGAAFSAHGALNDALDQAAQTDYDATEIENPFDPEDFKAWEDHVAELIEEASERAVEEDEHYYYVALYVQ